jgi:shikimate kinase
VTARHLVLVGMMGAGKTSVGRHCAARLDRPFVDTDELVEATTGLRVAEIFETQGEPAFRALERVAVSDACASPEPLVIACGGGAVLDAENRRTLRGAGTVVWLRAAPETLSRRCGQSGAARPLLAGSGSAPAAATLERLAGLRADTYDAASDAVVDTDDVSLDHVADAVVQIFEAAGAS